MASPDVLDLAKLAAALDSDRPTGVDLRNDPSPLSPFYAVKDARSAARAVERQILTGEDVPTPPDWRPVLREGVKVLGERSKDLEVAAYVIEALVRLHGFAGLRDGLRLVRELVFAFWEDLYPLPDEDGLETRLAPLAGLNGVEGEGTLIDPIARVPLTAGGGDGPFAYHHYQQALMVGQIPDEDLRAARIREGAASMPALERGAAETPASFFTTLVDDLTACLGELAGLGQVLEEKCGGEAPPSSSIRSALTSCLDAVNHIARNKLAAATQAAPAADGTAPAATTAAAEAGGVVRDREDAFREILKLAAFFRRTEPHSPVPFALEQAVRWGRMTLPDLLAELIPDDSSRTGLFKQVGIHPPRPPEG